MSTPYKGSDTGQFHSYSSKPSDDAYLASIASHQDKKYYNYLLNNPWMFSKQAEFTPTLWQQIGENLFDDYHARNGYYSSLQSNQQQWLAEALERFRQEEYNSASSQVERERAAGLNPDINGGIDPGAAAENDQPISPVEWPGDSVSAEIGSMSMQFISQVIGMVQSFQGLRLGNQQLVQGEISNNESARDFVLDQIAGSSFFNSENDLDHISASDLANNIIGASAKIDWSVYSPTTRKLMRRMFNRYAKDVVSGKSPMAVESLKSELRNRIVSNNQSAVSGASSPLFDEDFNTWLRQVAEVFGKYEYDAQSAEYSKRIAEAGYGAEYYNSLDPKKRAKAENAKAGFEASFNVSRDPKKLAEAETAESSAKSVTESQTAVIEGLWNEIYHICKNSNSWYGTIGLILIPFLRSMSGSLGVGFGRYGKNGKFGVTSIGM